MKRKKKKPIKLSKLRKQLWQLCRLIIIKRHGTNCYTCGVRNLVGSNLHLAHFISSSISSAELRYSLGNLRPCCYRCNIHLSGNWPAFEAHLIRDGIDVQALKALHFATQGIGPTKEFYLSKIVEYTAILEHETKVASK